MPARLPAYPGLPVEPFPRKPTPVILEYIRLRSQRVCRACEKQKPMTDFGRNGDILSRYCKDCANERAKTYRAKEEAKEVRWARLIKQYGITAEDYRRMLAEQGGVCAICKTKKPGRKGRKNFCVDHCHTTGVVRGIICEPCNTGLGHFRDNSTSLRTAADYLDRSRNPSHLLPISGGVIVKAE